MVSSFRSVFKSLLCLVNVYLLVSCGPKSGATKDRGVGGPTITAQTANQPGSPIQTETAPLPDSQNPSAVPALWGGTRGGTGDGPGLIKSNAAITSKQTAAAMGTSDSGGGTGIRNRVFESYAVDITTLPAYKKYVRPRILNVAPLPPEEWNLFLTSKNWYIAPVELIPVDKDSLGVSFMKSDTQQIARQSLKDVWIDKSVFDQMSPQDQGELLLHEIVMDLYFLKFLSFGDICKATSTQARAADDACNDGKEIAMIDRGLPAEKPHSLNQDDNQNIRFVTNWIWTDAQIHPIDKATLRHVFQSRGFDQRFLNQDSDQGSSTETLTVPGAAIAQAFEAARLSGHLPNHCQNAMGSSAKDCTVSLGKSAIGIGPSPLPGYSLTVRASAESPIQLSIPTVGDVYFTPQQANDGTILYTMPIADYRTQFSVGDRLYSGVALFEKSRDGAQWILHTIILRPGIIVGIDKKSKDVCQLRAPKVNRLFDDQIFIHEGSTATNLIEQSFTMMDIFSMCNADNVR